MGLRISRLTVIAVAALLAVGGCGKAFGGRVVYQGDYPSYQSLAELTEKATLIIEATVSGPRVDKLYASRDDGTEPNDDTGIVITVWSASVKAVHKGSSKPGDVVAVKQTGGQLDGVVYEEAGGVPLREGTTYLLFLETYPDAAASLLNPTQAQYEVAQDGTYRPVSEDNLITINRDDL
ncbi:hypothetical protein DFJ67_8363 [Asanoa ferruginea]|uniref:Uncharacterized protein n=1 Tax=Asanoa ferruginea TaxID=53367 RepID=A0A3E0A6W3_9ACTN|nr:hypothetical protein [Asanoa ferruginea]REG02271.1 hypothetical protein DFJ67_8363 [Asanoa ferruginea]GIF46508.1 hypothetical protein Afe04nite_10470 [Asanoa ferruginea]